MTLLRLQFWPLFGLSEAPAVRVPHSPLCDLCVSARVKFADLRSR